MKEKIAQLKIYFQNNPVMAFVAVVVLITVVLGGIAMAGSFSGNNEEDDQVKIEDEEKTNEEETEDEEVEEQEETVEEEDEDPTPTRKASATSPTVAATSATTPSPTPTPEEKKFSYNILGDIYEDKNCSNTRDAGEGTISKEATVNIYKMPEFSAFTSVKSNGSGHYSYSSQLKEGESIQLQPSAVAVDGYKINNKYNPPTFTIKQGDAIGRADIPFVPNANVDQCTL